MMLLGYFIRSALEMSQYILISSINEINTFNSTDRYKIVSLVYSIIMILSYLVMIGFVTYLTLSSYHLDKEKNNKLGEFFRGIKQDKKHRLYTIILLLRRLLFITFLILLATIASRALISIILIIQIIYFILLSYLRPCEQLKENLIEILNEIYFGFLILCLAIINTEDEWNSANTNIYMWLLTSNTCVVFFIVFGYFLKMIITYIRNKWKIKNENRNNTLKVIPKQTQINNERKIISKMNKNHLSRLNPDSLAIVQLEEENKSSVNLKISNNTPKMTENWN